MRLTAEQIATIKHAATECFGPGAQVMLFGSRVDDSKRGGDIDLLVRPHGLPPEQYLTRKIRFLGQLERALGERKIDIVIEQAEDRRPIVEAARQTGVNL
jgi:predicted nucleotidyltransferase